MVTLVLLGILSAGSLSIRADESKLVPLSTALSNTTISGQVATVPTYAAPKRPAYASAGAVTFVAPSQPVPYTWWKIVARWFGSNRSCTMQLFGPGYHWARPRLSARGCRDAWTPHQIH